MMSQQRQALTLSIIYSIPLLIWLTTQLQFIEWSHFYLQPLFRQLFSTLLLLQTLCITLLSLNRVDRQWSQDALGIIHIILFPLPFVALTWLTGSVNLNTIISGLLLISLIGALGILSRISIDFLAAGLKPLKIISPFVSITLAILMWNFRHLWMNWLEL